MLTDQIYKCCWNASRSRVCFLILFQLFQALQVSSLAKLGGMFASPEKITRIGYVTDIEGNLDYFNKYVGISKVLRYDAENRLQLDENGFFVFGGDLFDKGPGDMRLSSLLLDLKKRYPSRCFLLIGNRDCNKLRFTAELSRQEMERPLHQVPAIGIVSNTINPLEYFQSMGMENTKTNRLKWMLDKTLGCSNTFEFRREEIALLEDKENVSDEEVTKSFVESVQEGGFVFEYLKSAQLAVVIGDTLFVHGGIDLKNCRFVPALELPYFDRHTGEAVEHPDNQIPGYELPCTSNVEEWVNNLNQFASDCLAHYAESPLWDSKDRRGGEALFAYQSQAATQGRNVIVTSAFVRGNVLPLSEEVQSYLVSNGISRVVVGHKPVGDSPLVVREESQIERIFADTSRSDPTASDCRGEAVTEVLVNQYQDSAEKNHVHIHGILSDQQEYSFDLPSTSLENMQADTFPVGNQTLDGFWIKVAMHDGRYRVAKTVGHLVDYEYRTIEELQLKHCEKAVFY